MLAGQSEIASDNNRSAVGKIDFPHLPVAALPLCSEKTCSSGPYDASGKSRTCIDCPRSARGVLGLESAALSHEPIGDGWPVGLCVIAMIFLAF
jgi:hypothetical protein